MSLFVLMHGTRSRGFTDLLDGPDGQFFCFGDKHDSFLKLISFHYVTIWAPHLKLGSIHKCMILSNKYVRPLPANK
jgi:hypothetical protein